jgi:ABC-type glutathione transport system ATPase component
MKQRVVIALALANSPEVLIADEPTTGLDVLVQQGIVQLLTDLKETLNLSVLFITHDLPLVMHFADDIAVMYRGKIVDRGTTGEVYSNPIHDHTKALFRNFPRLRDEKRWERRDIENGNEASVVVDHVSKTFHSRRGLFGRELTPVHAVDDVTFRISPGEVVGIIGGSGSGKSTIANLITGLEKQDDGTILINGQSLKDADRAKRQEILKNVHLVFQDPYNSMRNHMRVLDVVAEPLQIHGFQDKDQLNKQVRHSLREVNLPDDADFLQRFPVELSGGQRQRLAFARAIIMQPNIIIADEPTSMLDVSLRMELLELMERLRELHRIGYIFITHDISLARHFCDRILVLREGVIVEQGFSDEIIDSPEHPYTRQLIEAAEEPEILKQRTIERVVS